MNPEIQSGPKLEAELLQQWNSVHGPAYSLRESDLRWNLEKQKLVEYTLTKVASTPVLLAKATQAGIESGLPSKNMWLSLWGKISNDQVFIEALRAKTKAAGKTKTVIGGDEFHLVAGVPLTPAGVKLQHALQLAKFEGAEAADYFGNINSNAVDEYITTARRECENRGLTFSEVITPADKSTAEQFLAKEFPGRWTREFKFWAQSEDTQRAFWKLLRTEEGEVIGFARMAVRGRALPLELNWTPGALRMPTQLTQPLHISNNDCCLGPIGVASSQRGQGTGKVLLGLVLDSLRNHKTEQICIDWTNAFKYYEPLHFEVARRYWTAWCTEDII